jgi:hypothetical protein
VSGLYQGSNSATPILARHWRDTMIKTTAITLTLVSALIGFAAAGQAQAASRAVMMSTDTFASRCANQDGMFVGGGDYYGCQIGNLQVECNFFAAGADCEWNGKSEQVAVVRLLGAPDFESITDKSIGGGEAAAPGTVVRIPGPPKQLSDIIAKAKF